MANTINTKRDLVGRYTVIQLCDSCGKPIHGDHLTDDEVCVGSDGPGFYLCNRTRCQTSYEDLTVDQRRVLFVRH